MTNDPFESSLDHLFAEVDEPHDAMAFRLALTVRLQSRLRVRRLAMGGAGLLGAAIAAFEARSVLPGFLGAARDAGAGAAGLLGPLGSMNMDTSLMVWTAVGLAVLAVNAAAGGLKRLG